MPRSPLLVRTTIQTALLLLCSTAPAFAQGLQWRPLRFGTHREFDMAFDDSRGRLVAVSGARTLEWDGVTWQARHPAVAPETRYGHRMTYDTARRRVVLFGGSTLVGYRNDVWQYDGATWTSARPTLAPAGRIDHAIAYDLLRARTIVFGGHTSNGGFLGDTWEWDGANWRSVPGAGPGARIESSMAFDLNSQSTILFGGAGAASSIPLDDTWSFDGTNWTQRFPATTPPRRAGHRMTADLGRGVVVMYGGPDATAWEWNGTDWNAGPAAPDMRTGFGMAHDTVQSRTVVFGGTTAAITTYQTNVLGDTLAYDGQAWTRLEGTGTQPRAGADSCFDSARNRLVFFGGGDALTSPTDTWEWGDNGWIQIVPTIQPPLVNLGQLCFDRTRSRSILFGGMIGFLISQDTTWSWDGANWQLLTPQVSPPARFDHRMTWDDARQRIVMFGGRDLAGTYADTWEWNGSIWNQAATTGPAARSAPAMAYDRARRRVVMFGGGLFTGLNPVYEMTDTWTWDGTTWTQAQPSVVPPGRAYAAMEYDAARNVVVLGGGRGRVLDREDAFEWNGSDWTPSANTMPGGAGVIMEWHERDGVMLLLRPEFASSMQISDDLWVGSTTTAGASVTGTGCAGNTAPSLLPFGAPVLGRSEMRLDLVHGGANAPALVGLSGTSASLPLGGGCTLYLGGSVYLMFALTNAAGFAELSLAVPPTPALAGLEAYLQGAVLDPGVTIGLAVSGQVAIRLGV